MPVILPLSTELDIVGKERPLDESSSALAKSRRKNMRTYAYSPSGVAPRHLALAVSSLQLLNGTGH